MAQRPFPVKDQKAWIRYEFHFRGVTRPARDDVAVLGGGRDTPAGLGGGYVRLAVVVLGGGHDTLVGVGGWLVLDAVVLVAHGPVRGVCGAPIFGLDEN